MKIRKIITLGFSLAALGCIQTAWADGTDAGTVVNNTATLSYSVGGNPQTDITSEVSDFIVDRKIDLTVTGDSAVNVIVSPSSSASSNQLIYKLKNEGNSTQDFQIDVSHITGTDQFDAGTGTTQTPLTPAICTYQIDGDATVYTIGTTATISGLAKDAEKTITVSCTMPNRPDVADGDLSEIDVLATAVDSGVIVTESSGADQEDVMDTVFADGTGTATDGAVRNAKHSDTQTFEINAPMLSVLKSSAVISDPHNGTTNPKRVPGAIIEYTIKIQNTSDSPATGVKVTDLIQTEDTEVNFIGAVVNASGTSQSFDDATNIVTADGITVPAGTAGAPGEAIVTFRVEIL